MERIWYYSATKLRDITHSSFCPEWEDPKGYSKLISMKKLLTSIGYNDSQANSIIQNMQVQSNLAESFQSCL
ncbi:hypothetical protein [Taylorella equigenitalis]|uniref:hypothetical protein n=1 Tax=Taylorella equigenitalis TaxID=29575 RepID=UPI0023B1F6EA|nr:hypothetical protein [Taylorella equigenitalis]WEE00706.1 hypothetical protein PZB79_01440 [Taylorella equigenitalis]WEE02183.1 hypothetical protein PZB80_01445 [Taylorella equigenitalis]WFD78719.1 hypothetical protein P7C95_01445 [Taylorella equigenitalis]WFD80197.1 hypothetical protein P7C94_01445 [Taylorella equigenitalis]WFD81674.1 hypothetical protein P7C86_01445 [Taylorella equigenitalis]